MKILISAFFSALVLSSCYYKEDLELELDYNIFDADYDGESPFVMDSTIFGIDTTYNYIIDVYSYHFYAYHYFHVNRDLLTNSVVNYTINVDHNSTFGNYSMNHFNSLNGDDHSFNFKYTFGSFTENQSFNIEDYLITICADYSFYHPRIEGKKFNHCYTVEN